MALQWDTTQCDKAKVSAFSPDKFTHMIFLTMFTGTGPTITDENVETWFKRIRAWERVYSDPRFADNVVSIADCEAFIGLHVNVPMWTDTRFANEMRRQLIEVTEEQAQREWKEAHQA